MSVFTPIAQGMREAVRQSVGIVTTSKGYAAIKAAHVTVSTSATLGNTQKVAFKTGKVLGTASKTLAFSLRNNFLTSLLVLEVADVVERQISKRKIKKEIRELTEYLARTSAMPDAVAQAQREADVSRLIFLEEMLPKRRSFGRFIRELPVRLARRVYRAAKTAIGTTGVIYTAPVAFAAFLIDLLWRVGVIVPLAAIRAYQGKPIDSARWTKYTGVLLKYAIIPFFFFAKIMVDGMTMRTWLEAEDVTSFEELMKSIDLKSPTLDDMDIDSVRRYGYETMHEFSQEHGPNKVMIYALILRTAAQQYKNHQWLASFQEGTREATPWYAKDLATV